MSGVRSHQQQPAAPQPAWFSDCAPSLLANKTVRRFLAAYTQAAWPEALKLALVAGVVALEREFPHGPLSLAELRQVAERGGASLVVDRSLPRLQRDILALQSNLDAVFDRLAVEAAPAATLDASAPAPGSLRQARPQPQQQQQQQQQQQRVLEARQSRTSSPGTRPRPRSALNPGPVAPKAPGAWRAGERTGFPSPPLGREHPPLTRAEDNQGATNPIYPDWWLAAGPPQPAPVRPQADAAPRRAQPRLAYSLPQAAQAAAPSSADAQPAPGLAHGPRISVSAAGPASVPAQTAAALLAGARGRAAVSGAARPAAKRSLAAGAAAPPRVQGVESKIKAALHAAARQHQGPRVVASAVASAAAGGLPPQLQQQQRAVPGGGLAAEAAAACPSAAAADHFLSNPWTAWFLEPGAAAAVGGAAPAVGGVAAAPRHQQQSERDEAAAEAAYAGVAAAEADAELPRDVDGEQEQQEGGADEPQLLMLAQQLCSLGSGAKGDGRQGGAAASGAARGVFADITSGLNAAHARRGGGGAPPAGSPPQQQQQQHRPWAHDFGHLENVDAPPGSAGSSGGRRGGRQHKKKWSDQWVGDFGHLDEYPRFGPQTAWGGEPARDHEAQPAGGDAGGGRLFMSPADLQQLVDAAGRLQAARGEAAAATAAVAAAVAAGGASDPPTHVEAAAEAAAGSEAAPATQPPSAAASEADSFETGSSGDADAAAAPAAEGDADAYLDGLEETSAMLQAALTRHDTLMQLIATLQAAAPPPDSELSCVPAAAEA